MQTSNSELQLDSTFVEVDLNYFGLPHFLGVDFRTHCNLRRNCSSNHFQLFVFWEFHLTISRWESWDICYFLLSCE